MNEKIEEVDNIKDLKELSVEQLIRGYVVSEEGLLTCIFCGETFEEGVVYARNGKLFTAKREAEEHMKAEHGGSFHVLVSLDKQICGLSDIQKNILSNMYEQNDNKVICESMGISVATVRTHKFNLQKAKREAKILLALLDIVEDEKLLLRAKLEKELQPREEANNSIYTLNSLHPFFTQFKHSGRL